MKTSNWLKQTIRRHLDSVNQKAVAQQVKEIQKICERMRATAKDLDYRLKAEDFDILGDQSLIIGNDCMKARELCGKLARLCNE